MALRGAKIYKSSFNVPPVAAVVDTFTITQSLTVQDEYYSYYTISDGTYVYTILGTRNNKPNYRCEINGLYAWWDGTIWVIGVVENVVSSIVAVTANQDAKLSSAGATGWYDARQYVSNMDSFSDYYIYGNGGNLFYSGFLSGTNQVKYNSEQSRWEVLQYGTTVVWYTSDNYNQYILTGSESWTEIPDMFTITQSLTVQDADYNYHTVSDGTYVYTQDGRYTGKPKYYCSTNSLYAWWDGYIWVISSTEEYLGSVVAVTANQDNKLSFYGADGWYDARQYFYTGDSFSDYYIYGKYGSYYYTGQNSESNNIQYNNGHNRWEILQYGSTVVWYASGGNSYCLTGNESWNAAPDSVTISSQYLTVTIHDTEYVISDGSYTYIQAGTSGGNPYYQCSINGLYAWYYSDSGGSVWIIGPDYYNCSNAYAVIPGYSGKLSNVYGVTYSWISAKVTITSIGAYNGDYYFAYPHYYTGSSTSISYDSGNSRWVVPNYAPEYYLQNYNVILDGSEYWSAI